jgi:carbon-monoxide dehydrogenase small subunit
VGYALAGSLAQFSRGSIVQDIAKKLTDAFASNLSYELARKKDPLLNQGHQRKPQTELNAGSVILSVLLSRMRNLVAAVINFFKGR